MFLYEMGFSNIIAIGNKDFQKKKLLETGLPESKYLDSREDDWEKRFKKLSDGHGADIIFECIGRSTTIT